MHRFMRWLAREFRALLPIWLFFFAAFGLLNLTRAVMLARYGIENPGFSEFFIGSLIVAKVFLVFDDLKLSNRFNRLPVIYGSIWRTLIFTVASLAVKYLEDLVHLVRKHRPVALASREVLQEMRTPQYGVTIIWLVILLFVYCATRELIRSAGKERFFEVFFGSSPRHRFD